MADAMAHPIQGESPMEPGLWQVVIAGTVHIPSPPTNEATSRVVQVCIKPHESPAKPFLPPMHGHCTTTHKPLASGREQWNIHCTTPNGAVDQLGWIQSQAQNFDSHWHMTDNITSPTRYTVETSIHMKGHWIGSNCGAIH